MIRKYRINNPIFTDAVVEDIKISNDEIKYFKIKDNIISYRLSDMDLIYGLGENVRGLNKRGYQYVSDNSDDPVHTEEKVSLYGTFNFLVIDGEQNLGIFIDTPSTVKFDLGFSKYDELKIEIVENNYDFYLIEAKDSYQIIKEFRKLIGKSYIPPKFAFGYGQSRWSYFNSEEVIEVVKKHRENQIPLDMVYLDIDYMQDYMDFTINQNSFKDFGKLVKKMQEDNIHLIPIIDAGIKVKVDYEVCKEGVENNFFCKNDNGEDMIFGVWPGDCYLPDFLNSECRKWFGKKYKVLTDLGIDGFWNDMNEPAIFYTKARLNNFFKEVEKYKDKNLSIDEFFKFKDLTNNLTSKDDYKLFYHNVSNQMIRHDKVHNLYGYNMTKAAKEALDILLLNQRCLLFSRSSYIGMHRYGGIWQGDNQSWWSHLKLNIIMTQSLNMVGYLYTGADIGGFGGNCSRDLLLRWLEFGLFTPLMRNHSALNTRKQEVYNYEKIEDFRNIIGLRYALIPYIYTEYINAVNNYEMYMRPLAFDYKDDRCKEIEDQILVGNSIMIAPVYQQNATGRMVYLPETMKLLKMKAYNDFQEIIYFKGDHYISVGLNEVLIFIRNHAVLPLGSFATNINEVDYSKIRYYSFNTDKKYIIYNDDGITKI